MTKKRKIIATAALFAVIGWVAFIFSNSLTPGDDSGAVSDAVSKVFMQLFGIDDNPETLAVVGHFIRKLGHFVEFFILGSCMFTAVFAFTDGIKTSPVYAFVMSSCCAAIDESIQYYVPGRGPAVADWALDSSAVLCSVIILTVYCYFRYKRVKK